MCTWEDTVVWCFLDSLFCWVCWMHCLHPSRPLTAGMHCFALCNFSLQHVLLLLCLIPDLHNEHNCSVPSAWMMSSFSSPARVAISSSSFCEWVPYHFEQNLSLQVSMSICVGPLDPNEFLALDAISSWVMFSKITLSVLVSGLSVMADCFISTACWVLFFQILCDICSDVMFSINLIGIIHKSKGPFHLSL